MPPNFIHDGLRVLELDGGGINVLSALLIVWELMRRIQAVRNLAEIPLPCDFFDLICGTGTAGLVAVLLGRLRLPATAAIVCYMEIMKRGFVKKGLGIRLGTDGVFSATALEKVIGEIVERHCGRADEKMVDEQRQGKLCKVMVCAMPADAIRGGVPTLIRTYRVAANQGPECTIVEAVRATMAMPGMFKRACIIEQSVKTRYVGGGLGCNNATAHMLDEVGLIFPGRPLATVLSVGSGQLHSANVPNRIRLLQFLPSQLVETLGSIAMDCERTNQELSRRFSHTPNIYFRFNAEQGMQDIEQSDTARLPEVQAHTQNYLKDAIVSSRMDDAVRVIVAGAGTVNIIGGNVQIHRQPNLRILRCPAPSRNFTGRKDTLEQMQAYFTSYSPLNRHLFVLSGLGGAGKTQLALNFVHLYHDMFWEIYYIDATSRNTIASGLIPIAATAKEGETPEDALAWLASQKKRWLLVFNNADDPDLNLHDFFPECAHGDILITTRNQQMVNHATGPESYCCVGGMRPDDALQLLLETSGADRTEDTVSTAKMLIEELSYFALAIVQSGAYMRARRFGVTEYFRIFQTARAHLLSVRPSIQAGSYQLSVFATWEINCGRLSSRATWFLHMMSFMHHEGISEAFFESASARIMSYKPWIPLTESQASTKTSVFDFLASLRTSSDEWDPLALKDLTDQLRTFSLLDYDTHTGSYSMHPLVQEWSRNSAPDMMTMRECATWVLALCVNEEFGSNDYAFRRRLLPHLLALDSGDAQIIPELAIYLRLVYDEAGYGQEEEVLLSVALQATRDGFGNQHPTTLTCMHNLASAFLKQGKLEQAETLLTEVAEANKRAHGHEHPDTLTSMNNLALTYRNQRRWQEAESVLLEVIEARKRANGTEHSHTVASMQVLAMTYRDQGRLLEAETLEVEALETTQRMLGREHPDTLVAMHNLAATYEEQGKLREAELLMEETVCLRKKVHGESHVRTRLSVQDLEIIQQRIRLELVPASDP